MCGICGVVELDRPADRPAVETMLDRLAHRGPDGRGVFADDGVCLGHLRLAIIDLSAAGLEPFASEDGRLQLVFNGEIYNYLGLREVRYWTLERHDPPAEPVAAVREAFLDAVRLQLRADVPVGTCLSGGIDSSSIAVAVAEHGHEHQKTVTAYFEDKGFDERPF